jgi:uncharacterized protein
VQSVTEWASGQDVVSALALVGSYAYNRPRMGSDVDLVLLTNDPDKYTRDIDWVVSFDPRARLIRDQKWGPLRERRVRLRSGLQVELGVAPTTWAALPLDPGTEKVLRDGCQVLYDPKGILQTALATL